MPSSSYELSREGLTQPLYAHRAARLLEEFRDELILIDRFSGLFVSLSERVERGQDITEEQEAMVRRRMKL